MAFSISTIIAAPKSPHIRLIHTNPLSLPLFPSPSPPILSFPAFSPIIRPPPPFFALKSGRTSNTTNNNSNSNSGIGYDAYGADLLRKPVSSVEGGGGYEEEAEGGRSSEEGWVDWEDQILEDTVPLVGFVRMILHSGKYKSGDRLSPEHEKTILERLLPYHPECAKKIGSGVDYITVGYHPDFESSRCLFIVRTDGQLVDFSYWKCLKGLIKKNYPLYADSFILRHFRRRRRSE